MKKTLITLLAMCGVAGAADLSLTTGISYTPAGGETVIVDGYTEPTSYTDIGHSYANWPGSKELASLDFTITLSNLYGANAISDTDVISLNSLIIKVNSSGWCQDEGRTITLTSGSYKYQAELEDIHSATGSGDEGVLTLTPTNWTLTKDAVLGVSIKPAAGTATLSVASADIYGKNGATVAWSGVTNIDMSANWGNEAPLVQLNVSVTPAVPEPTTATLSLLALAGLAARRRRK